MPTSRTPTVLVVGGGFAGRAAVRHLLAISDDCDLHVVLVDEKDFFEFTPSVLRCIVDPDHIHAITFPHAERGLRFVKGRVTHLSTSEAAIERRLPTGCTSVMSIPFDFCIWAPGVLYARPIHSPAQLDVCNVPRRREELHQFRTRILNAEHILIVGAGPIGVELAAELTHLASPSHEFRLTLAASPRGVLPRLPAAAGRYATQWLTQRGVILLRARLKSSGACADGRHEYQDDQRNYTIRADIVFDCTGPRCNDSALALVAGGVISLDGIMKDGSILVHETLQTDVDSNIFVAGDGARVPLELVNVPLGLGCEKTAYGGEQGGMIAARNVEQLMRRDKVIRKRPKGLLRFPRDGFPLGRFPRLLVISLYKYDGILCFGPVVVCGVVPSVVKAGIEIVGVVGVRAGGLALFILRAVEWMSFLIATVLAGVAEYTKQLAPSLLRREQ